MERPDLMLATVVCREMKWTWTDYRSQPMWFIQLLIGLLSAEAKERAKQSRKTNG